jgi:hypothetical protein
MGKFLTALLSIVFQLYLIGSVFADDQVRKIQEELRKRHLFYGDITGEISPALTKAITRYQEKKGFARSGLIDSETLASLGIADHPSQTRTPFVVQNNGEIRGPNGEPLPSWLPLHWATDERPTQFDTAMMDQDHVTLGFAGAAVERARENGIAANARTHGRVRRVKPPQETNPIILAFHSVDHAVKFLFGDNDAGNKRKVAAKSSRPSRRTKVASAH